MRPRTHSMVAISFNLPSANNVGGKVSTGQHKRIHPPNHPRLCLGLLLMSQSFAFVQKEQHLHKRNQVKAGLVLCEKW